MNEDQNLIDNLQTKWYAPRLPPEDRMLLRHGFSMLPLPVVEDGNYNRVCPFAFDGICEGVKDAEKDQNAYKRCFECGYLKCEIYQECVSQDTEPNNKSAPQSLQDTVVMHADEVHNRESEDSLDDQLNEGASPIRFEGMRKSLSKDQRWRY